MPLPCGDVETLCITQLLDTPTMGGGRSRACPVTGKNAFSLMIISPSHLRVFESSDSVDSDVVSPSTRSRGCFFGPSMGPPSSAPAYRRVLFPYFFLCFSAAWAHRLMARLTRFDVSMKSSVPTFYFRSMLSSASRSII